MPEDVRSQVLGVVGIGNMGGAIAKTMVREGFNVLVYDVRQDAIDELVNVGARAADSLSDLAHQARIISIIVISDEQVRDVALALLDMVEPGTIIIVHSTIRTSTIVELATMGRDRDVVVFDCSLNGGQEGALRGRLTLMIGGDDEPVQYCWPIFEAIGDIILHLGKAGAGATAKLVNNMIILGSYALQLEAMQLAAALGFDEDTVTRACIAALGDSKGLRSWGVLDRKRRDRQSAGTDWSERPGRELLEAVVTAGEHGVVLPLTASAAQMMPFKLRQRDRELDRLYGANVNPPIPHCEVCDFELAAPFRSAGVHPDCVALQ